MKFILISVGTRGDVEPFLTLANLLKNKGHECICAFPEQFKNLAEDAGIKFFGLSPKFLELIEGEDAVNIMGGKMSPLKKILLLIKLYKLGVIVNKELVVEQKKLLEDMKPDRVIFNGKSTYPFIWEILHPGRSIFLSPIPCLVHAVNEYPHLGFKSNYGKFINRLTYKLSNFGLLKNIESTTKEVRKDLGVKKRELKKVLFSTRMVYAISPSLFQQRSYWPKHVKVVGYHERNKTSNWQASEELVSFIKKHPKILFFTFGSMTNPEPEEKTRIILQILEKHKIPAIINTASGGLKKPDFFDSELIHFVDKIPYDWAFSKVHAVIHHGGSGTTHTSLKYACATMIIPHIIDQYLWNNLMHKAGVGPKGISVDKITVENLEPKILEIFSNESFKEKARDISKQMNTEQLENDLYDILVS